ncbi:hypothetical protein GOODEAATRI_010940 [Goodea atripinnis]|uniref:Uncharacterized protein n=1 Tax=Goodea atripinnis TaxID=208336 RepID=A0ABV0P363_9TELE
MGHNCKLEGKRNIFLGLQICKMWCVFQVTPPESNFVEPPFTGNTATNLMGYFSTSFAHLKNENCSHSQPTFTYGAHIGRKWAENGLQMELTKTQLPNVSCLYRFDLGTLMVKCGIHMGSICAA